MKEPRSKPKQDAGSPGKKRWGAKSWLREGLMIIVLFTLFSTAMDYWRSQEMPTGNVPALVSQTIQGEDIDLVALSHKKPVMLYFWATWCPACKFVSPTVDWMSDHFEVVTIAMTSGDNRRLNAYMDSQDYSFRVINDNNGRLGREWGITATPSIVIIKDGTISSITTGVSTPPGLWLRMLMS
ncbi:redoxin domain-containing protein [Photobacterium sp. SDRW27]|uniref:protein disulfide oxidoreductase n=1 Tax=Photobacterium obscurum TaxID=2829490 RepID=UPI0022442191|nr:redoxin domain-containing protein [Photobacterium obscurum]MCW8328592.1 redoxin domain-containing protein [Photobacterium obscurum]